VVSGEVNNYFLVAKSTLRKNQIICIFSSEFAEKSSPPSNWYSFKVQTNKFAVVTDRVKAHFGMFMNDALDIDGNNAKVACVKIPSGGGSEEEVAVVKASSRDIAKGESVCLPYGRDYWIDFLGNFHADNSLKEKVKTFYDISKY
jgi:hypothetical protein